MSLLLKKNIKLLVCDMAGTIINEKGIIYDAIENTLNLIGYNVEQSEKETWYGKDKREVLYNHVHKHAISVPDIDFIVNTAEDLLITELEKQYFSDSNIELMEGVTDLFDELRINGTKVALNTGYPKNLQQKIIQNFNLEGRIDAYISSEQVKYGRPYPFMIHNLMHQCEIETVSSVAKIGDTVNDILEGKNAGCGLTIGVLSGAGKKEQLEKVSDLIFKDISNLI